MTSKVQARKLRRQRFYDPPFDRRRFLLFPASWPFIDGFGCVLWIDSDWQVLGANEIQFFTSHYLDGAVLRNGIIHIPTNPFARTPPGPLEIEHVHVMVPSRAFYKTVPFRCRLLSDAHAILWFHDHGLPSFEKEPAS